MKSIFATGSTILCLGGALAAFTFTAVPDEAASQSSRSAGARRAQPAAAARGPALDLARGAKEAPAAVQAAGVRCSVSAAAFLGGSATTVNGATVNRNGYEVACSEGLGFIVLAPQTAGAAPTQAIDCVTAQTTARVDQAAGRPAGVQCRLPGNAQPAQGLQAIAREAGAACTVSNARAIGVISATGTTRYEIACSEGAGYVLDRPQAASAKPTAQTCFRAEATGGQFRCEFTTKAQSLATLAPVITASRRSCTVSDARIVGRNPQSQNEVLEVGCGSEPGFFVETAPNTGAFVRAVNCGQLGSAACQFTAAEVAQERNAQDYTQLLRAARVDCAVSKFTRTGRDASGREIIEAACSNRPEGVFALLAAQGATGRSETADCLVAAVAYRHTCGLTSVSTLYPAITRALRTQSIGRDCTVTGTRVMGRTPQGENWVEIGCSNGRSYVIDYGGDSVIDRIVACGQATEILGGCRRSFPDSRPVS